MQLMVKCTAQEPMVEIEPKEGSNRTEKLKKVSLHFKGENDEFVGEALGPLAERLSNSSLLTDTYYLVDFSLSRRSWKNEQGQWNFATSVRINKIQVANFGLV